MNGQAQEPCDILSWDSDFFQHRIARVRGNTLTRSQSAEIDLWSRANAVECLYFLARADDPPTIAAAEAGGFGLVDLRVSFERKLAGAPAAPGSSPSFPAMIREFRQGDLPELQAVARTVHRQTRFFNDPRFAPEKAEELYSTWIALECQGRAQTVLVAVSEADRPLGYVSCRFDAARRAGEIGLLGVHSAARGKSLAKNLILTALDWFRARGAEEAMVVTQGTNVAAQRVYQRQGFLLRDLQLWYHKWYKAPVTRPSVT